MNASDTRPLELIYEGSVKRVWKAPDASNHLWFEFTDDYSVFDWGKMPDTIENKGRALAAMGGFFFEKLSKASFWQSVPKAESLKKFDAAWLEKRFKHSVFTKLCRDGAPHHFKSIRDRQAAIPLSAAGTTAEQVFMEVLSAQVNRPALEHILYQSVHFYPTERKQDVLSLIPLEIVFRFGMPGGSSLIDRIKRDPSVLQELGLKQAEPGQFFEHPVIEFYTKLEPKDRLLSWQEAALMSGLNASQFEEMLELALDIALALHVIFAECGIELWDGKVEMVGEGDKILLADSIGPDELRLLYRQVHLSKEMIRQIYRGTKWEVSIQEAQKLAKADGKRGWKEIAVEQLKIAPEPLPAESKTIVNHLYGVIANHLIGEQVFKDHPTLEQFIDGLPAKLKQEPAKSLTEAK